MAEQLPDLATDPQVAGLVLVALTVLLTAGVMLPRYLRSRVSPQEQERQRRLLIHENGKLGDGEIIDVEGNVIIYSYRFAGVGYTASQDITALAALLPADPVRIVGPATVKFLPRNPANSIVLCEEWNGLSRLPQV